jgi:hypothetical protein
MADYRKEKPTFEDVERKLGRDKTSFASEMVPPDPEDERDEDTNNASNGFTPDEQNLIQLLESDYGRKLGSLRRRKSIWP